MDPLQWLNLDGPSPYATGGGTAMFQQPSQYFTQRAIRERAMQDQEMKRQAQQLAVQQALARRQEEEAATMAAPFIAALDPLAEDFQQQQIQATQRIAPQALLNPAIQGMLRDKAYDARYAAKPNTGVESLLTKFPELQDDFDAESATLGKQAALKNLRWKASDRDLETQLGQYGFDFTQQEKLNTLRLPGKPYLDPVRVASWIKREGTKGLDTLTPDKELEYRSAYAKALEKAAELAPIDPATSKVWADQANAFKSLLDSRGPSVPTPPPPSPVAPPTSAALPVDQQWQAAKQRVIGTLFQAAGNNPAVVQEILRDPQRRREVMRGLSGQQALTQNRWGSDVVNYNEVLNDLIRTNSFGVPMQPGEFSGGGVPVGQSVPPPAPGWTIKRIR